MHYRVHRCLAVHVTKHTYDFSQLEFWGNTSLGRQPVNHLVVMVMEDCKAEMSLQSLPGSLSDLNICAHVLTLANSIYWFPLPFQLPVVI